MISCFKKEFDEHCIDPAYDITIYTAPIAVYRRALSGYPLDKCVIMI